LPTQHVAVNEAENTAQEADSSMIRSAFGPIVNPETADFNP
jgi:hypothetical protein